MDVPQETGFGEAIRAALGAPQRTELSKSNALVLMAIVYFQPITRGELSQFLGREVSRDAIAELRGEGIAAGPRSPTARPTPMSRRRVSWRNSGSNPYATCRTSRSSRMWGCSVGRAGTCLMARRWIPSCGECSGWKPTTMNQRRMQHNDNGCPWSTTG
jgi:Segregation and condensation complex subunit ScpB